MTDPLDLARFDDDALYAIHLLHDLQATRYDPANADWYRADQARIQAEMTRRKHP